jgi:hypothetical protein
MFQISCPCHCNKCMSLLFLGHANSGYFTDYGRASSQEVATWVTTDYVSTSVTGSVAPLLRQNQGSSP